MRGSISFKTSKNPSDYSAAWQDPLEFGPLRGVEANGMAWFAKELVPSKEVPVRLTGASGGWVEHAGRANGKLKLLTSPAR